MMVGLYPGHGCLCGSESCVEEGLDLVEIVGRAEGCESLLADHHHISVELSISNNTAELLDDFIQLLELFAEWVRLLFNRASEHVERGSVFPRRAVGVEASSWLHVLEGPLLRQAFVGAFAV